MSRKFTFLLVGIGGIILLSVLSFLQNKNSLSNTVLENTPTVTHLKEKQSASSLVGAIDTINEGLVSGWVKNTSSNAITAIRLYIDKPKDSSGTQLFFEAKESTFIKKSNGTYGFEVSIPASAGDEKTHVLYGYAVTSGGFTPLSPSPKEFSFKSIPLARITILSPWPGQVVVGDVLKIQYKIEGSLSDLGHVHWALDGQEDYHDLEASGTFQIPFLEPGSHKLTAWQASGHHDRILNSDVSVKFISR